MSVFEQKIDEEFNDFELVEKEEERTESPEMVEIKDVKDLEAVEKMAPEEAKNSEVAKVTPKEAEQHAPGAEGSQDAQLVEQYFEKHSLKNEDTKKEVEASAPWSVPESLEHEFSKFMEKMEKGEKAPRARPTAEDLANIREFYKLIDSEATHTNAMLLTENVPVVRNEETLALEEEKEAEDELPVKLGITEEIKKSIEEKLANFNNIRFSMNHTTLGNHEIVVTKEQLKKSMFIVVPMLLMTTMLIVNWMNNLLIASQLTQITKSIESFCGCAINKGNLAPWRLPPVFIIYLFILGHLIRRNRLHLTCFQMFTDFLFAVRIYIEMRFDLFFLNLIM